MADAKPRGRGLNGIITEPPKQGTYEYVLRRTDRALWPWRVAMYNQIYIARGPVHPDSVQAPTMFVSGSHSGVHRMKLIRMGWIDVTDPWFKASKAGWVSGVESSTELESSADEDLMEDIELDGPTEDDAVEASTAREQLASMGREVWERQAARRGISHEGVGDDELIDAIMVAAGYRLPEPLQEPESVVVPEPKAAPEDDGPQSMSMDYGQVMGLAYRDAQGMARDLGLSTGGTAGDIRVRVAEKLGLIAHP